jgi:hypothetical protein
MASMHDRIVTVASFYPPKSVSEADPPQEALTPEGQIRQAQYEQIMQRLQQAADEVDADVMISAQDREVSLAQSLLAEKADAQRALDSGGQEVQFGTGVSGGDWFRWVWSLTDWVGRKDAHPLLRPATAKADPLPESFRLGMVADWGTGLYGAPKCAASLRNMAGPQKFDLLMHLGDVYYSGTPKECEDRFTKIWPADAAKVNRALNGNHEMYSGGVGYFKGILPSFNQSSSYFAYQNDFWVLAGLDTAYVDHDMDTQQVAWLNLIIKQAEWPKRKVVLFSHQQPFSRLDKGGPKLQTALKPLLDAKVITAWYWGHEHQCVIYDAHPQWGLLGRCLGHGGIPEARKDEVKKAPADASHPGGGGCTWKRLNATAESPGGLALDGMNLDMKDKKDQEKFVPHGFMTLEFNREHLTERVFTSGGTEILSQQVA